MYNQNHLIYNGNSSSSSGSGSSSSNINNNNNINNLNICNYANNLNFVSNITKYGVFKIYVDSQNPDLVNLYRTHILSHNNSILNDQFPNSGFDLFVPVQTTFMRGNASQMINHAVKGEMCLVDTTTRLIEPAAFMLYPRSSLSKTELMLSNHTGIIDSGYRGFIMGAFRWLKLENDGRDQYMVDRYTRLLQICLPTLHPIFVVMVDESELTDTTRGGGGFGSTGL